MMRRRASNRLFFTFMLVYLYKVGCKITYYFATGQTFLHIFADNLVYIPYLLLFHVEADAHTLVLLAQFSDGLEICPTTQGGHGLQDIQQFFALKKNGDAVQFSFGVTVDGEQQALQFDLLVCLVEGVCAAEIGTGNLRGEGAVLVKGNKGIGR